MAQATRKCDCSDNATSAKAQEDERESSAFFDNIMKFLNNNLSNVILKSFKTRLELLRKSSFFITVLPRQISFGQQHDVQLVNIFHILDSQRFERMKKIGADQTKMQLFLLQEYLERLRKGRTELIELVQSRDKELFLAKHKAPAQLVSELEELICNFKNLLVPGPLHIKHHLVPCVTVHPIPPLRLFLNTKGPVMFDREESRAFGDWAFLSLHVSGQQNLTGRCELSFRQLNVPLNGEGHCGMYIMERSTIKIPNLRPERTYEFSIRRAEAINLVYNEWRDVITMTMGSSLRRTKYCLFGDCKTRRWKN